MAFISYERTKNENGTIETTFRIDPVALIIILIIIITGAAVIFTN